MTSHTETIIAALRVLARDIQSNDGIANAAIAEAADRLEEQQERIKRLEEAGDRLAGFTPPSSDRYMAWTKAKETKP